MRGYVTLFGTRLELAPASPLMATSTTAPASPRTGATRRPWAPSGGWTRPPGQGSHGIARYLISFNDGAMDHIPDDDWPDVGKASHAVVQHAVNAGVFVFGAGLERQRASVVARDGTVTDGPYPETKEVIGGFVVVDVASREEALTWAAKICRRLPLRARGSRTHA